MLSGEILRLSARRHPRKAALICGDRCLDYGEFDAAANRFAHAVLRLGLRKGDTVAVMSTNVPEYPIVHFGIARTGCLLVNLSPMFGPDEITHIMGKTEASVIVVHEDAQDKIAALRDSLPKLRHVVVIGTPTAAGTLSFDDFCGGMPDVPPEVELSESDPFAMTFTGGTTGFPKGALVTHGARFVSAYTVAIEHELCTADTAGVFTPLYHAVSMLIWMQAAVLVGATCVLQPKWDPAKFIDAVERHRITTVLLVPVQLQGVLSDPSFAADRLATLRQIGSGGAVLPAELMRACCTALPHTLVIDHYGQSETGPLTILRSTHPAEKATSIGRPAVGVDLKVVGTEGNEVAPGEIGEIVVKGPFLFAGYFLNPEETEAYFRTGDGWGWTGDLATVDADGFITLAGRSKEMIVTGGINVYPREVEVVLEADAGIEDCAVFGIPDEKWGEALVAYVVLRAGYAVTENGVIGLCEAHLARYKRPKHVRIVDAIPKTPSGKTQKAILRAAFLEEMGLTPVDG